MTEALLDPSSRVVSASPASGAGAKGRGQGDTPAVVLSGITVRFGGCAAVRDLDLRLKQGEFLAVVGPTGCGKSTILNSVAGLVRPCEGAVFSAGEAVEGLNRRAGYLFQTDALLPQRTALENVMLGPRLRGAGRDEARSSALLWLGKAGLSGHEHKYPHQLSGGQRKRVQMAQVLILDPPIVLMDEPFSALDVHTRHRMQSELLRLWQEEGGERRSVIFITHDLEEAIGLADRVAVMSAGPESRIVAEFEVGLERPRDVESLKTCAEFTEIYREIWRRLKKEVDRSHAD